MQITYVSPRVRFPDAVLLAVARPELERFRRAGALTVRHDLPVVHALHLSIGVALAAAGRTLR